MGRSSPDSAAARLARLIRAANRAAFHVAHAALWLLSGVVLYDVGVRSLGSPTVWGSEVSVYLMLAIAFLGAGHTWTQGGHFRVTVLVDTVSPKACRALDFVCTAVALAFTIAFTIGAWRLAAFSFTLKFTTPTVLRVPIWLLQGLIVLGGVFLALALFEELLRIARGERRDAATPLLPTE